MTLLCAGIDEAGLGPLLGPMGLVCVAVEAESREQVVGAFRSRPLGVADSKQVHKTGDLAPLESVALAAVAWITGRVPETASEFFFLLGERRQHRPCPWMAGAERLRLPQRISRSAVHRWRLEELGAASLQGFLVHPRRFNDAYRAGTNRSALELELVGELLGRLPRNREVDVLVDRLGGRRYYGDFLAALWPGCTLAEQQDGPAISRYELRYRRRRRRVAFAVNGERHCPLAAVASCIAKYARELHMHLFNRYWSRRFRSLRPTAGYARDARRWLADLGPEQVEAVAEDLVRGPLPAEAGPAPAAAAAPEALGAAAAADGRNGIAAP